MRSFCGVLLVGGPRGRCPLVLVYVYSRCDMMYSALLYDSGDLIVMEEVHHGVL